MGARGPKPAQALIGSPLRLPAPRGWSKRLGDTWREVVWPLGDAGRVAAEDGVALQAFVMAVDSMRQAQRVLEDDGYFVESPNGYRIANPAVAIRDSSMREVRAWCGKFGCTLADRGRVRVPVAEQTPQQKVAASIGESPREKLRMVK